MNITLEKKILAKMLQKPEEVEMFTIKSKWFGDRTTRDLAHTLLNTDKKFNDFSEIELTVKEYFPKSKVTEEWLHQIKFEEMFVEDLEKSIKALEAEYVQDRLNESMLAHLEYPSNKNKEAVEDWFRIQAELNEDEPTGELDEPINQFLYELENELEDGVRSFTKLDNYLGRGLTGGMLFVLAARPALGKTTYAMNIVLETLRKQPETYVDFFSLEMTQEELLKKMVSNNLRINSYKFKNPSLGLNDEEKRMVVNSLDWLKKTGLNIHSDKVKLKDIERTIKQRQHQAKSKGVKYMAVVDYVGLVQAEGLSDQRYREVGVISRTFKMLTNTLNIPIILISQLNRGVEMRDDQKPHLSDLRESGDLEQDANVVGLISATDVEDLKNKELKLSMTLDIAKNRGGMTGEIEYFYDKTTQHFKEINH